MLSVGRFGFPRERRIFKIGRRAMMRGNHVGILLFCVLLLAGCTPINPIKVLLSDRALPAETAPPVVHVPVSSDVLIVGGITTGLKSTGTVEFYNIRAG